LQSLRFAPKVFGASGNRMPRYFFALQWPERTDHDLGGTVLPNHDAAYAHARRIIRELKDGGGYDEPGLTMVVRDHEGAVIHSLPF
jgi:hypothetical protein